MAKDLKFDPIIERLQAIHVSFPDLRFGQVLQVAMDKKFRKHNENISDRASKEILTALDEFEAEHKDLRRRNK